MTFFPISRRDLSAVAYEIAVLIYPPLNSSMIAWVYATCTARESFILVANKTSFGDFSML